MNSLSWTSYDYLHLRWIKLPSKKFLISFVALQAAKIFPGQFHFHESFFFLVANFFFFTKLWFIKNFSRINTRKAFHCCFHKIAVLMPRHDERKCVELSNTKNLNKSMAISKFFTSRSLQKKNSINLMKQTKEKYEVIVSCYIVNFWVHFFSPESTHRRARFFHRICN